MRKISKIFISYAREDRTRARRVYVRLLKEGFIPWMDSEDLVAGRWEHAIKTAIRESDFFLVLLSQHSIAKRGYLQTEIREALSGFAQRPSSDVYVIPARLEVCPIPDALVNFQCVDLFERSGWQTMMRALTHRTASKEPIAELKHTIKELKEDAAAKRHIFVAMPFAEGMEDIYYYGIMRAVDASGYTCERIDQASFTGSILNEIKTKIETSVALIADLTGSNPNVHLELGYAWGKQIPTVLLTQEAKALCFDVRDQRCIEYRNIKTLEGSLTKELATLKSKGRI